MADRVRAANSCSTSLRSPEPLSGVSALPGNDQGREEWDSADLALHIEGLFSAATDNACTCGSDPEGRCRYCAAWAAALYKTEALLAEVLGDR